MFQRYTETARRVIFFARFEAGQFGIPSVETEHLLLGFLRENMALTNRLLPTIGSIESIRKQIEGRGLAQSRVSSSATFGSVTPECRGPTKQVRATFAISGSEPWQNNVRAAN
jgi:ATP-dependent Clp protease ATP-binding subunit ClpC